MLILRCRSSEALLRMTMMFMMNMMMLVNNIITIPSVDIFMTMMVAIIIIIVSIIRTAVKASTVTIRMVILIMIAGVSALHWSANMYVSLSCFTIKNIYLSHSLCLSLSSFIHSFVLSFFVRFPLHPCIFFSSFLCHRCLSLGSLQPGDLAPVYPLAS